MPRFAVILLRLFGLARPKPRTRLHRSIRRFERAFAVVVLACCGLHAFPQPLFAYSVTSSGITLYARHPISAQAVDRLAQARVLIDRGELAIPGRPERVFVCDSPWLFRFFAPRSAGAFAISAQATSNIFIAAADIDTNQVTCPASQYNKRSFSGVVAHEVTHGLIRRRLGLWRSLRLPSWVEEGYCDYIAGDGSFPESEGLRLLVEGGNLPSNSFQYYKDRRMVAYLIEDRHLSFEEVVKQGRDTQIVEAETREALRSRGVR